MLLDPVFENAVDGFDIFKNLIPAFLGNLTECRECALILSGANDFVIHFMLF